MSDDLLNTLARFHREVMLPDVKQAVQESEQRIVRESLAHYDAVYKRFDRLEVEYHSLAAAVGRIELQFA